MQAILRIIQIMIEEIKFKLDKISDFWSHYICDYHKCKNEINFNRNNLTTTSYANLMSYLGDTLDVIENKNDSTNFQGSFSYHIGLLQAIYIQQDLIQELLKIFRCEISKGDLYEDSNYNINRNLRNELVGHPIRKTRIEHNNKIVEVLKSSVLMDIHSNTNEISYARYHIDNKYSYEKLTYKIDDIISRHYDFLNTYLDKIINKAKKILKNFRGRVNVLKKVLETQSFESIVNLTALDFESIFNSYYIYDPKYLLESHKRRDEHIRYQNNVNEFLKDLQSWLNETLENLEFAFKERIFESKMTETNSLFNAEYSKALEKPKLDYHYELGKLGSKKGNEEFDFFSGLLKDKCNDNLEVLKEIEHMEKNRFNELEYHCSLKLIRKILNEE